MEVEPEASSGDYPSGVHFATSSNNPIACGWNDACLLAFEWLLLKFKELVEDHPESEPPERSKGASLSFHVLAYWRPPACFPRSASAGAGGQMPEVRNLISQRRPFGSKRSSVDPLPLGKALSKSRDPKPSFSGGAT
jgi:hypothetical protein